MLQVGQLFTHLLSFQCLKHPFSSFMRRCDSISSLLRHLNRLMSFLYVSTFLHASAFPFCLLGAKSRPRLLRHGYLYCSSQQYLCHCRQSNAPRRLNGCHRPRGSLCQHGGIGRIHCIYQPLHFGRRHGPRVIYSNLKILLRFHHIRYCVTRNFQLDDSAMSKTRYLDICPSIVTPRPACFTPPVC